MGLNNQEISAQKISTVVELLRRLQPGFLPEEIFHAIARLTVLTALEMVPFSLDTAGRTQVLLLRRSPEDRFWPNRLHVPGTIVRATDHGENFEGTIERLLKGEMGDPTVVNRPVIFGVTLRSSIRGTETLIKSWVQISDAPKGELYPFGNLPKALIQEEIPHIQSAHEHFRNANFPR